MENRPQGREKHVTGQGKDIQRRGSGLGTGPVGSTPSHISRPTGSQGSGSQRSSATSSSGGKRSPLIAIIIAAVVLLGGGGAGLSGLFGGSSESTTDSYTSSYTTYTQAPSTGSGSYSSIGGSSSGSGLLGGIDISSLLGSSVGSVSSGWSGTNNTARLNTSVDPAARAKRTAILGGGQDTVTIMVYMCGSDLESKSGMGTSDLAEMTSANLSDQVNLLVYTGGSSAWKNNVVSSSVNQIYKVESGGMRRLVENDGTAAMTSPATLTGFIKYCADNYPANRYELILWDHGGGSISGYGYDEKNARSGSMSLKGIDTALSNAGVTFDFVGFDACLMGTLENGLTIAPYADYLIASEETEPGIGWYYTGWLTALSQNTSMSTLEIGKRIVDDFVETCNTKCSGQKTTLSVVDLAELEKTVPESFKDFAVSLSEMMTENNYKAVSDARTGSREFATSSKVDQVDLVDLARNLNTTESNALAQTLLSAVKYNRTSSSMTNAYGISIYFPYQKVSRVDSAVNAYDALGLDSDYTRCIQQFASLEAGGQAVSGGSASPISSLLGASSGGSMMSGDLISGLLGSFLGGSNSFGVSGLTGSNSSFLGKGLLDTESAAQYLSDYRFDPAALQWTFDGSNYVMALPEEQWTLVHDLALNVYYDDGEGFIDLGLDNVFDFTDEGALLGEYDGTWLAINGQPVPYYYIDTVMDGSNYTITGRVPVLLNGSRADLILVFDSASPYGYIAGARTDYRNGETETVSKSFDELAEGDVIDFVCDYYAYDGTYLDSYMMGEQWLYDGTVEISNVYINADAAMATYLFTDIYCQSYWTPVIP